MFSQKLMFIFLVTIVAGCGKIDGLKEKRYKENPGKYFTGNWSRLEEDKVGCIWITYIDISKENLSQTYFKSYPGKEKEFYRFSRYEYSYKIIKEGVTKDGVPFVQIKIAYHENEVWTIFLYPKNDTMDLYIRNQFSGKYERYY